MASNVDVKITADVVDLQAKFAVAKAESSALTAELNKLARQAAASGGTMSSELRTSLTQAAEAAVRAKAEVAELNSQLKGTTSGGSSMVGMLGSLKGGLASLGVAITAGQMLAFAKTVEESSAHIAHEAEVLQLSITAYQAFSQAAIDSGVDTETADGAIRRFTTALGLAQEGMGVQAKAFVELGVSAHQTGDVALPQVAQALLAVKDDGERARLATELFGKSGAELIPLLQQWAQGTDNLTAKYTALGRILDPETAKAAEAADIKLEGAWEHLKVAAAGPIAVATNALAGFVDMLTRVRVEVGTFQGLQLPFLPGIGLTLAPPVTPPAPKPPPKPVAPTEQDEIAALDTVDSKMRQRALLEKEVAMARKALNDAEKAGDTKGIEKATQAVADLKKELDALNKPEADPGAKAAAAAARKAKQEEAAFDRMIAEMLNAEAKSDSETQLTLAKLTLDGKKSLLQEEFDAHKITAQQKYDATVAALNAEADAEKKAKQDIINSGDTTVVEKYEAANQIKIIDAQTNAAIAAAARTLTADLKAEDQKRYESWRTVNSEIESAESTLVNDIFTKRQGLALDLLQIGAKLVEDEIANELKLLTEHELVNLGMLKSDQVTAQEGLLGKLIAYATETAATTTKETSQTAATAAGTAARTSITSSGVIASKTITTTAAASEISQDAAKAGAGAYASVVGIPIIGPILAPIAAGVAFAAVEAFGSFAQGVNVVPHDMIAQVHAGERIIPAADNRALMGALGGLQGGKASGGDVHLNYSPVINAPQHKSLGTMLDEESGTMRAWFQSQMRDGYIRT